MTAPCINPCAQTQPAGDLALDPNIGRWQVYCNGEKYGPEWTWLECVTSHVLAARRYLPDYTFTLVNAKTGNRVACDDQEWQELLVAEYEAREAEEGWGESPDFTGHPVHTNTDWTLPQGDLDFSDLPGKVETHGKVLIGDVRTAAVLIDLAMVLKALGLAVRPIGLQRVEVTAAPACGDCFATEALVRLPEGRVICQGCRAQLEALIGPQPVEAVL